MDGTQRALWGMALVTIGAVVVGFFVIPGDAQVPHQFDLNGWTTFSSKAYALFGFAVAAVFGAVTTRYLVHRLPTWWARIFSFALMALLMTTTTLAIFHAAQAERIVRIAG